MIWIKKQSYLLIVLLLTNRNLLVELLYKSNMLYMCSCADIQRNGTPSHAILLILNRYASYAGQPSQNYGQSTQVRFIIAWY